MSGVSGTVLLITHKGPIRARRVDSVKGWDLCVHHSVLQKCGGKVSKVDGAEYEWRPGKGYELYYLWSWRDEQKEVDYYAACRSWGRKIYLECVHTSTLPSRLLRVPVKDVVPRVLSKPAGASVTRFTWRRG